MKKGVALAGTEAGNTDICTVGHNGNDLHYRGYEIHDLPEGILLLEQKFERHLRAGISEKRADQILAICADQQRFEGVDVDEVMSLLQD